MDPLSVLGTVVGVASAGTQLSLSLYELVGRIRHAPKEMVAIAQEMQTLSSTLNLLQEQLSENPTLFRQQIYDDTYTILLRLQEEQDAVRRLVKRNTGVHRLRWAFQRSDASVILCKIEGLKSLLNVVMQVASMQVAIHQSKEIKAVRAEAQQKGARVSRFRGLVEAAVEASRQTIKDMSVQEAILQLSELEDDLMEAHRVGDYQAATELEEYAIPDQEHRISQLESEDSTLARGSAGRDGQLFKSFGPIQDTATFLYNLIFASPPAYSAPQQLHERVAPGGSDNVQGAAGANLGGQAASRFDKNIEEEREPGRAKSASADSTYRPNTDRTSVSLQDRTTRTSSTLRPTPEDAAGVVNRLLLGWTTMSPEEMESSGTGDIDNAATQTAPTSTRTETNGGIDIEGALGSRGTYANDIKTKGGVRFETRQPSRTHSARERSRYAYPDRTRSRIISQSPYNESQPPADLRYTYPRPIPYPRPDRSGYPQPDRSTGRERYENVPSRATEEDLAVEIKRLRKELRGERGLLSRPPEPWEIERQRWKVELEKLEEKVKHEAEQERWKDVKRELERKMEHDQLNKEREKAEAEASKQRAVREFVAVQEEKKRAEDDLRLQIRREIKEEADKQEFMRLKMMRELEESGLLKSGQGSLQSPVDQEDLPWLRKTNDFQAGLVAQLLAQNRSLTWLAVAEIQARAVTEQQLSGALHQALTDGPSPVIAALRSPPQSTTSRDEHTAAGGRSRDSGDAISVHESEGGSVSSGEKSLNPIVMDDEKQIHVRGKSQTKVNASPPSASGEDRVREKIEAGNTPEEAEVVEEYNGGLPWQEPEDKDSSGEPVEELPAVGFPPEHVILPEDGMLVEEVE